MSQTVVPTYATMLASDDPKLLPVNVICVNATPRGGAAFVTFGMGMTWNVAGVGVFDDAMPNTYTTMLYSVAEGTALALSTHDNWLLALVMTTLPQEYGPICTDTVDAVLPKPKPSMVNVCEAIPATGLMSTTSGVNT
jgi:hypothetical protein